MQPLMISKPTPSASTLCDELVSEVHALISDVSSAAGVLHADLQGGIPELEKSIKVLSEQPSREVVLAESLKLMRQQKQLVSSAQVAQAQTSLLQAQISELRQGLIDAKRSAEHDVLTGLPNRLGLAHQIEGLLAEHRPLCLAVIDLDKFKAVNDEHGHFAGDKVLEHFAHLCRTTLTSSEIVARWGGEEFLVVLPDVALQGAVVAMESLRRRLECTPACFGEGQRVSITCSIGLTEQHGLADNFENLYARADRACYQAKEKGRNQITVVRNAR